MSMHRELRCVESVRSHRNLPSQPGYYQMEFCRTCSVDRFVQKLSNKTLPLKKELYISENKLESAGTFLHRYFVVELQLAAKCSFLEYLHLILSAYVSRSIAKRWNAPAVSNFWLRRGLLPTVREDSRTPTHNLIARVCEARCIIVPCNARTSGVC